MNKNLTAAIFWQESGDNPVGTAWLCSDCHLLTASHCVLDPQTQKSQGPFRLKFPLGDVPCDKIAWWDIGLDVALLAIDPASTSGSVHVRSTDGTPENGYARFAATFVPSDVCLPN